MAPSAAAPPNTAAWSSRGGCGAAAAGKAPGAVGCGHPGGDTHSPRGQAGTMPQGSAVRPVPGVGLGFSGGHRWIISALLLPLIHVWRGQD